MTDAIKWFLGIEILGWVVFPFTFNLFNRFADKGFSITKVFSLLIWGYLFWVGNTFHSFSNSQLSAIFTIIVIVVFSFITFRKTKIQLFFKWLKENYFLILFFEVLFMIAYFGWVLVRAGNPEIIGTEKPMELAFINAIHRSPDFPPNDPWLSGYSISYYYFGYLIVALMMKLLSTPSGVAFNLAISLWFALTAVVSSGLLFNLIVHFNHSKQRAVIKSYGYQELIFSLFAPFFILIMSNAEGFLEVLHSAGYFWSLDEGGNWTSKFWGWLNIQELNQNPMLPLDFTPSRLGGVWWWRASRVLQDFTNLGAGRDIIDEFPFFSFLLADFHPHLISLPFVLMAIFFAAFIFIYPDAQNQPFSDILKYWFSKKGLLVAFITGSLLLINTWDFPIYFFLLSLVHILPVTISQGWNFRQIIEYFYHALILGILSVIFYLPFLIGLSSQAGGFLPSLIFRTRTVHYFVMFFPFLMPLSIALIYFLRRNHLFPKFIAYFIGISCGVIGLLVITFFIPIFLQKQIDILYWLDIHMDLELVNAIQVASERTRAFLGIYEAQTLNDLVINSFQRFQKDPFLILLLTSWIAALITIIIKKKIKSNDQKINENSINIADKFIFFLLLLVCSLSLAPEIVYLRDQFGWRMNTIFKFYYQVWVLFAISMAYLCYRLIRKSDGYCKTMFIIFVMVGIITGSIYPFYSLKDKTNNFSKIDWTLDGNSYIHPLESEAIHFLEKTRYGIIAEAIGISYSSFGRVSKLSGLPTVLGWPGHELQWRGGIEEMGSREQDIRGLYSTSDWIRSQEILDAYNIRYIYLGQLERATYSVNETKFSKNLPVIFQNEEVIIYTYTKNY